MITHKKVKFQDTEYWCHDDGDGYELISPLNHYNEKGELLADSFNDISFAIIEDGLIKRYQKVIGTINDLEDVE